MSQKEISMLIKLREYTIREFSQLNHKGNPTAMMREMDAARTLETIVRSIEDVLRPHVEIK